MAEIAITATAVLPGANARQNTRTLAAGVTVTQGQVLYLTAAGTLGLADSNGTTPANSVEGIALTAGSPGQPCTYLTYDTAFTLGGTLTAGQVVYLGNTPGSVTATYADVASGSTVIVLGIATSAALMTWNPQVGGTKA